MILLASVTVRPRPISDKSIYKLNLFYDNLLAPCEDY